MDSHHTHTQYINNLNTASFFKPPLCDVIYDCCKAALPEIKNQEEVEISVHAYVLSMQQQKGSGDEIYEGSHKMCNDIGCPLKFYEDTILPFEDTSGAAAAAKQKVEKEACDASSQASKEFSNKLS